MTDTNFAVPEIHSFDQLIERARLMTGDRPCRAAVVAPYHQDSFVACKQAIDAGLIAPVMIGERAKVQAADAEAGLDLGKIDLIEAESDTDAVDAALRLATTGEVDVIIKGSIGIRSFARRFVVHESGFVLPGRLAGHIAVIKPAAYRKLLLLTDAGIVVQPDLKQKIALTNNMIDFAHRIGIEQPRIAILAAVEVVYPQMPVTVEAAVLSKMNERRQIKGGYVDGPLSFDCAVDRFAAESKGITTSEVAGQADAMLAGNIETAHGVYKAMALYGRAQLGGIVFGGKVPVAMAAVSDTAETLFHSIVLAVLAH